MSVLDEIHDMTEVMERNRAPKPWVVRLSHDKGQALEVELIERTICCEPFPKFPPAPAGTKQVRVSGVLVRWPENPGDH